MDGQAGRNSPADAFFAFPLTETGPDLAATYGPDGSARTGAALRTAALEPCGSSAIHPGKA